MNNNFKVIARECRSQEVRTTTYIAAPSYNSMYIAKKLASSTFIDLSGL